MKKLGLFALRSNASCSISLPALETPMNQLTIMWIKSYGTKWQDSRCLLRITVLRAAGEGEHAGSEKDGKEVVLEGSHASLTSETYRENVSFWPQLEHGDRVGIELTLIGGTTFTVKGLALCKSAARPTTPFRERLAQPLAHPMTGSRPTGFGSYPPH